MKNFLWISALALCLAACGGGGGSSTPTSTASASTPASTAAVTQSANTVSFTVDQTYGVANVPYVNVTICEPGTSTCATIDHVIIDSGSVGLRLLASALPAGFPQPVVSDPATAQQLAECEVFGSGFTWGPLSQYDIKIGGETAHNVPVQVVDDSFGALPTSCSSSGASMGASGTTSFHGKGLLGLDVGRQDCGSTCATSATDEYWVCTGTTCTQSKIATATQVTNPIIGFPADNNGMLLTLPTISSNGSPAVNGTLTFGINTQTNNQRSAATVLTTDSNGDFSSVFNGTTLPGFIDSGSSIYFFADTSVASCTTGSATGWFCPASTTQLGATLTGVTSGALNATMTLGNADSLLRTGNVAFNDLGLNQSLFSQNMLDLGLPFFFGKSVFFGVVGGDPTIASGSAYVAVQ